MAGTNEYAPWRGFDAPTRRRLLTALCCASAAVSLAACAPSRLRAATDVSGSLPPLSFVMTRAEDGRPVTAQDFRGKVVLLYFGYRSCPDACPTTLASLSVALARLGAKAEQVRVLFVTVDPGRDTLALLKSYVSSFGSQFVGLRGTPDQIAALARRYRVAYSVTPSPDPTKYEVTHSAAVYAFDATGAARLLFPELSSAKVDPGAVAYDLAPMISAD